MKLEDFKTIVETRLKAESRNATEKSFLLEVYKVAEELKNKQNGKKEVAAIYDYARMCMSFEYCSTCPLSYSNNGKNKNCANFITQHTDKANEVILKYLAEHTVKTYRQDFCEKFPNADISKLCIESVYGKSRRELGIYKECDGCSKCWDSPMPDE